MVDPVTIGFGTNKWLKDSDTNFISLFRPSTATGTRTMHEDTNIDYIVPAGKKYIILGIGFDVTEIEIYYDPVVDTPGTMVWGQEVQSFKPNAVVWIEIPAGNYVNVMCAAPAQAKGTLWGIETTV